MMRLVESVVQEYANQLNDYLTARAGKSVPFHDISGALALNVIGKAGAIYLVTAKPVITLL